MAIKILEFLDGNLAIFSLDGLYRVQSKRRGVVLASYGWATKPSEKWQPTARLGSASPSLTTS